MFEFISNNQSWLIIIGVVVVGLYLASKHKNKKPVLPYELNTSLLTANELNFFKALITAVDSKLYISPKVRMIDFVSVIKGSDEYATHRNKIISKHIDFLLCNNDTMAPVCAVELDDRSHKSEKVQERDALVNQIYEAVNLPIVRIQSQRIYSDENIRATLLKYLS